MINTCLKYLNKYNSHFLKFSKKTFDLTIAQKMEKLKHISVYKRKMANMGINFTSKISQEMLKESLAEDSASSFFQIIDQLHTQTDPMYCGPATMTCIFNALGIDPKAKWKGIWRWYLEEVIKCVDLEKIKNHGMTLEEFAIISKCNGVFTEVFRPDEKENDTVDKMISIIRRRLEKFEETSLDLSLDIKSVLREEKLTEIESKKEFDYEHEHGSEYDNQYDIIAHSENNTECKKSFHLKIKECNLDFFRTVIYASTRRENFFTITNTSRKALKQTGDGHFSPVAAYHRKSDNILILDSARFKYNSMWFDIESIYNAFTQKDKATNLQRGFILASRYYYLCPRICKTSIDINSSHFLSDALDKTKNEFTTSSGKSTDNVFKNIFSNYLQTFVNNISLFNDIQSKSQLLYYHHDLENRSSFTLNDEFCKEYIKYEHDNTDITKEIIFHHLKTISDNLIPVYLDCLKSNDQLKNFFVFLFYLDNKNFLEFFTLTLLAYLDYSNIKFTNFSSHGNLNEEIFYQNLIRIKNNPVIQKEIKIVKECLNLRIPLKSLCKNFS